MVGWKGAGGDRGKWFSEKGGRDRSGDGKG